MAAIYLVGVDARAVAVVSESWSGRIGREPVFQEISGDPQFQVLRADAVELVRDVAGPGQQFLEDLTAPVEAGRIVSRDRAIVDQAVRGKPYVDAAPGVLVSLKLDLEERDSVTAGGAHAVPDETVRVRVFGRGVVEHDDIAAAPI